MADAGPVLPAVPQEPHPDRPVTADADHPVLARNDDRSGDFISAALNFVQQFGFGDILAIIHSYFWFNVKIAFQMGWTMGVFLKI